MVAGYRGRAPDSVCRPVGGRCYVACVRAYLDLLDHVLTHGVDRSDRTGTGTGRGERQVRQRSEVAAMTEPSTV
jgi:hypothetical protein